MSLTGSSSTDNITSDPTLTGTGDANAVVSLHSRRQRHRRHRHCRRVRRLELHTDWPGPGSHTIVASETDVAGNTGHRLADLHARQHRAAPSSRAWSTTPAPRATDKITSNPALTGTGDANAVGHFSIDGSAIAGTATADASGAWSFTPTGLVNGPHTIVASETNAAGNTGTASLTFTLDTVAPAMTARLANDTGASSTDRITSTPR